MGIFWYIFCDLTYQSEEEIALSADPSSTNFFNAFSLKEKSNWDKLISLYYFTFTSLSTVGLGDYHPKSNSERLLGSFILLFGVAMTSFVMQNFSDMLVKIREVNKGFDDQESLCMFFGTLERFNGDVKLNPDL